MVFYRARKAVWDRVAYPGWLGTSPEKLREAERQMLSPVRSRVEELSVPVGHGNHIHALAVGDPRKPALLLAHGYSAGAAQFAPAFDLLAAEHRVYAFDWLGWGRSSRPTFTGCTAKEAESFFTDSLAAFVRQVCGASEPYHLAAHSMGGMLAVAFVEGLAPEERARVRLSLISPLGVPALPNTAQPLPAGLRAITHVAPRTTPLSLLRAAGPLAPRLVTRLRGHLAGRYHEYFSAAGITDGDRRIGDYWYHCNALHSSGDVAVNFILHKGRIFARNPILGRLEGLRGLKGGDPLSFVYGDHDWMPAQPGMEAVQRLQDMGVHAKFRIVPRSGHNIFADNPKGFVECLK
jgi:pimeloyl-ACP methyl ester carboxylesterase